MQHKEIIGFWGKDNLRCWSKASLQDAAIPLSSKLFLSKVGLPLQVDWTLHFDSEANLPRLSKINHYRRIGFDDFVPLCLDEQHYGRVVAVEQDIGGIERYINANVECFSECLIYYQQYRTSVRSVAERDVVTAIVTTEKQMQKADTTAFDNPDNWWPVIIEQMKQGLL